MDRKDLLSTSNNFGSSRYLHLQRMLPMAAVVRIWYQVPSFKPFQRLRINNSSFIRRFFSRSPSQTKPVILMGMELLHDYLRYPEQSKQGRLRSEGLCVIAVDDWASDRVNKLLGTRHSGRSSFLSLCWSFRRARGVAMKHAGLDITKY